MERQIVIGDMVMVIGKQFLYTSFGKTGQVMGLDENVQPGELFASITRKEAISIIVNTLGISKETAENFIEDAGEVLEDGAISGTGGTTSVKN